MWLAPLWRSLSHDKNPSTGMCSFSGERHKGPNLWFWETKQNLRRRLAPSTPLSKVLGQKKVYRLVCLLMDHKENQSPAQEREHNQLAELIRVTWGFAKDFSVNEVRHVLGILSVNSFVVHDGLEDGMDLIGLYPWTSLMSHACVPNVKIITRDDFSYICEATVPIKSPNEIVTSYHHTYSG